MGAGGLIQGITERDLPWRGGLLMGEEVRGRNERYARIEGVRDECK